MSTAALVATRITIWLALASYALAAITFLFSKQRAPWRALARWAWTAGCLIFLAHVFCAFNFYHHWSHAVAYRETARQTGEITGWNWGGGLFVSYAFTVIWIIDVLQWWRQGLESYSRRPKVALIAWHVFFFFIVFNSTVVFATGLARWSGALLCSGLLLAGTIAIRRNTK